MRYALKRIHDGFIFEMVGWNKKSHAAYWINEHIKIRPLDWRVGARFKCKNDIELEVVWSKSHKPIKWFDVTPCSKEEYEEIYDT